MARFGEVDVECHEGEFAYWRKKAKPAKWLGLGATIR